MVLPVVAGLQTWLRSSSFGFKTFVSKAVPMRSSVRICAYSREVSDRASSTDCDILAVLRAPSPANSWCKTSSPVPDSYPSRDRTIASRCCDHKQSLRGIPANQDAMGIECALTLLYPRRAGTQCYAGFTASDIDDEALELLRVLAVRRPFLAESFCKQTGKHTFQRCPGTEHDQSINGKTKTRTCKRLSRAVKCR